MREIERKDKRDRRESAEEKTEDGARVGSVYKRGTISSPWRSCLVK
jgi:hypothetical protein